MEREKEEIIKMINAMQNMYNISYLHRFIERMFETEQTSNTETDFNNDNSLCEAI